MNQLYPFMGLNSGALIPGQQIPKVKGLEEAKNYPCPPNTEVVLLDSDDESVLYFRKTDVNGYCTVERHRHFPDPEPSQQELNDQRYISVETFNKFREEILDAINRRSNGETTTTKKYDANRTNKQQSGANAQVHGEHKSGT